MLYAFCLRRFHEQGDFRDIRRLVADALHVGNHLQRGGDLPQIPRHGLLVQQQAHAHVFYHALFLVYLFVQFNRLPGQGGVGFEQAVYRACDRLLAEGAHGRQLIVHLLHLGCKLIAHYPNLPVI